MSKFFVHFLFGLLSFCCWVVSVLYWQIIFKNRNLHFLRSVHREFFHVLVIFWNDRNVKHWILTYITQEDKLKIYNTTWIKMYKTINSVSPVQFFVQTFKSDDVCSVGTCNKVCWGWSKLEYRNIIIFISSLYRWNTGRNVQISKVWKSHLSL